MHEGLFTTVLSKVGTFRGSLLGRLLFLYLCRSIDKSLEVVSLLRNALPCFGLPGSRDLGTISADVPELTAGVAFSIFLPYLGVVDFPAVIHVVIV